MWYTSIKVICITTLIVILNIITFLGDFENMSNSRLSETDLDFFREKLEELTANEDFDIKFRMQLICTELIAGEIWRQEYFKI